MSLVSVNNLSLSFGARNIFRKIYFQVENGERTGLIGPNGSGKTSLLKILGGGLTHDSGEIVKAKGSRIGYLPQDIQEVSSGPLLESMIKKIPHRNELLEEIKVLEHSLNKNSGKGVQVKKGTRLAETHRELAELETRYPVHKAEKILNGLGFKEKDFGQPVSSLSGGWKMRAALAGILYQDPDLLLLDEPTNHLDLDSVRWLEEFLQEFKGAMFLVCHDRDFLNRQISRTLSLEPEGLKNYSGNYDFYINAREQEKRVLEAKARNREQKVKEANRFIERFRAKATKARQVQSKIKLLDKMELIKTHKKEKTLKFSFPDVPRAGRIVVTLEGISKGFDGKKLYRDVSLSVMRGDRVALIGPNGAGKTTLLRMIAGELQPDRGRISLGHGVTMSYYAQHHSEMLSPGRTVLEEVYKMVPHEDVARVRALCGAFLFPGEDVEKTVGVLSGGERARVALAKILVKPGNLMVMDEPTNHLDIMSSEVLIEALRDFKGTLIFVSHNQGFVDRLSTKIWDIREGKIDEYPGSLYEYYDHLSKMQVKQAPGPSRETGRGVPEQEAQSVSIPQSQKERRRQRADRRKQIADTLKPIQKRLHRLEERIEGLETRKAELEQVLADSELFRDKERSLPLLNEYGEVRKKLDELIGRWEYRQQELESAKETLGIKDDDSLGASPEMEG